MISRGFVYVREAEEFIEEIKHLARDALEKCQGKSWSTMKSTVKDALRDYLYQKIKRKPMILPIIMDILNSLQHDVEVLPGRE
ncbi:hypothetical protein Bccel_2910 [Pseudobacteroides cellulosolvens ATCC 35603 = DSM 2933]|uniref:Ribonuclease J C-terminal domain-containing protein n=1 Tax=Pseudobacteroides cellulosolvens ATCC 35603 = DSM 2933 TaxID=398512 RepID=A0A0L6JPC4_9FIRM|nr:hypothetical protein Bccel_2910 [Pseudobacteroides cellulosolvens ATCC 35603 = DSM 2933]